MFRSTSIPFLIVPILAACAGAAGDPVDASAFIGVDWRLERYGPGAPEQVRDAGGVPSAADRPSLRIGEDGAVSGSTGVNRWSTRLDHDGLAAGRWQLGSIAMTQRAGTAAQLAHEQVFLAALEQASRVRVERDERGDQRLVLLDGSGRAVAWFAAVDPAAGRSGPR